jgi:heterotetrameric sarcosine oxidase gamma subunit
MSLEFLAPDAARSDGGEVPPARSPIEWVHRGAGARFAERAGWRMVAGYGAGDAAACRDAVGVADLSHIGKLELQGEPERVASIVSGQTGGGALEPGRALRQDGVWWCPVSAGKVMALTPPEATGRLRAELESAAGSSSAAGVVELTAALGSNAVVGPLAREAFARTTALDLRPEHFGEGAFAPVSVARTPAMVLRADGDRFLHLFGAGFASYVWTVFIDAAADLGGAAVGAETVGGLFAQGVGAGA